MIKRIKHAIIKIKYILPFKMGNFVLVRMGEHHRPQTGWMILINTKRYCKVILFFGMEIVKHPRPRCDDRLQQFELK